MTDEDEDEEAISLLQETVKNSLQEISENLRDIAQIMQKNEVHFNEETFDELPRIADRLDEFAGKID